MTRTTGATESQIEAAALEYWIRTSNVPWVNLSQSHRDVVIRKITDAAELIVTTDHRIVRVDDLRALIEHTVWRDDDHEGHAALSRIVDLIGEAE